MPEMIESVKVGQEFYNVSEEYTWYDTVAVVNGLDAYSKNPPGWYSTFALFSAANQHSFFNVRNVGNTDDAYCNLATRDQTASAFRVREISCAFWGSGFCQQTKDYLYRSWLPNALWQTVLPFESSLTLRIQQDDKLKANALMLSPGYGPWGGGYGNIGSPNATLFLHQHANVSTQTQGMPICSARFQFPNVIDIPRRASIAADLSLTPYARALFGAIPGPGWANYYNSDYSATLHANIMFGVTVGLHGQRLVQQRGELHA